MSAKSPDQPDTPPDPYRKLQGPYTEKDIYVAVIRAWSDIPSRHTRRERPWRGFVLGWHFVSSVERQPVDLRDVVAAILQIVSPPSGTPNDGALSLPLRSEKEGPLDPVSAWWQLIAGSDELGVHYVELSTATVALLTAARHDDQPDPGESH